MEAATAFFSLRRRIEPKYLHPDMDWDEALQNVVEDFQASEKRLETFAAQYGPILSDKNRKNLERCISMASANKFAASPMGDDLRAAKDAAEKFLSMLKGIEDRFVKEIRE